jgi:GT2 family glycosyltransferase
MDRSEMTRSEDTGIVAIGRNEGERLRHCLESSVPQARHVVYVDSGSTDGSLEMARELGATVVELDKAQPFTAARARNAGFEALEAQAARRGTPLQCVQFVDGDCELEFDWMGRAREAMDSETDVVVVCGRRAERYPEHSVYNLLCDMEWDTPIGEALECGGDALMRVDAFRGVGGFSPDLIAGEEPELCGRLRQAGGRVLRIDAPMTLHDARIDSLSQWWTRNVRDGHARAESAAGQDPDVAKRAARFSGSVMFWGLILPLAIGTSFVLAPVTGLLLLALYPLQVTRIALGRPAPRFSDADQWRYAVACLIGKIPNMQGQLRFWLGRITGRRSTLIEYKGPVVASESGDASPASGSPSTRGSA